MFYLGLFGMFLVFYACSYYCVNKKCALCESTLMHGAAHKKKFILLCFLTIIAGNPLIKNTWRDDAFTLLRKSEEQKIWIVREEPEDEPEEEPEDEPEDKPQNTVACFIFYPLRRIINMECQLCGSTSLHNAGFDKRHLKLQFLIDFGGDPLKKNMWGDTPQSLGYVPPKA